MKLFTFAVILCGCIWSTNQLLFTEITHIWNAYINIYNDICIEESNVDRVLADRAAHYGDYVDDHKFKCWALCIMRNLHMMHENGTVNGKDILRVLNLNEQIANFAGIKENCFNIFIKDDNCEGAFQVSQCIWNAVYKVFSENKDSQHQTFTDLKMIWQGYFTKHKDVCQKETDVESTLAERVVTFGEFVENPNLKCYVTCILQKEKIIDENHQVDDNVFFDKLGVTDPLVIQHSRAVDRCLYKNYDDKCEQGFRLFKCMYTEMKRAMDKFDNDRLLMQHRKLDSETFRSKFQ